MTYADVTTLLEQEAPRALTPTAIAAKLDRGPSSTGSICSKLFAYGKIDRLPLTGYANRFLYRAKVRS